VAVIETTIIDEAGNPVVVRIEVADISEAPDHERITRGSKQVTDRAKEAFNESMQLIHTCAAQISTAIHKIPPNLKPKEYEVQFSVKVDGKIGAFIAQSSMGGQLQVTLKWAEKETK
jgi:copper chaperone CopZ